MHVFWYSQNQYFITVEDINLYTPKIQTKIYEATCIQLYFVQKKVGTSCEIVSIPDLNKINIKFAIKYLFLHPSFSLHLLKYAQVLLYISEVQADILIFFI